MNKDIGIKERIENLGKKIKAYNASARKFMKETKIDVPIIRSTVTGDDIKNPSKYIRNLNSFSEEAQKNILDLAKNKNFVIWSIRNKNNKPNATVQLIIDKSNNFVTIPQFKGRFNRGFVDTYAARLFYDYIHDNFKAVHFQDMTAFGNKFFDSRENKLIPLSLWKDGGIINGDLNLESYYINQLPRGLRINGNLNINSYANFLITSGDIFEAETTLYENWSLGKNSSVKSIPASDVLGRYHLNFKHHKYELIVEGDEWNPKAKLAVYKDVFDEISKNSNNITFMTNEMIYVYCNNNIFGIDLKQIK